MKYPNLFKSRYPNLSGSDWILRLEKDDIKAFVELGLAEAEHGHLGGVARAKTCTRDSRGRFTKKVDEPEPDVMNDHLGVIIVNNTN